MRVSRRRVVRGLAALSLPLLTACGNAPAAREPSQAPVYRIGWMAEGEPLSASTPLDWSSPIPPTSQRLVERLAELGYVEGRTLHWELRRATAPDQLTAAAAELVGLGVDLILVGAAPLALRAAVQAPGTTPVVGSFLIDPVGQGYAQSLARPGGKLTGVTDGAPGAVSGAKRLDVFKEALPTLTRLGVLLDGEPQSLLTREKVLANFGAAARQLGVALVVAEFRALEELDGACAALAGAGVEGVLPQVRARWTGGATAPRIVGEALRYRLPTSGLSRQWVTAGALVSYNPDPVAVAGRHAELVDKVLRGARPGDVPIENPDMYELALNLKTARELGLTIPQTMLARATTLIQ